MSKIDSVKTYIKVMSVEANQILYGSLGSRGRALDIWGLHLGTEVDISLLLWLQDNYRFRSVNGYDGGSTWGVVSNELSSDLGEALKISPGGKLFSVAEEELYSQSEHFVNTFADADPAPRPLNKVISIADGFTELRTLEGMRGFKADENAIEAVQLLSPDSRQELKRWHICTATAPDGSADRLLCWLDSLRVAEKRDNSDRTIYGYVRLSMEDTGSGQSSQWRTYH